MADLSSAPVGGLLNADAGMSCSDTRKYQAFVTGGSTGTGTTGLYSQKAQHTMKMKGAVQAGRHLE